jgi:hypothetical protein
MLAVRTVASASQSASATVAAHRTVSRRGDVEQRCQSDDPDAGEQLEQDDRAEPRRVRACGGEHIAHVARQHRGREEPSGKARDELRDEGGTDVPRDLSLRRGGHDAHLPERQPAPRARRPGHFCQASPTGCRRRGRRATPTASKAAAARAACSASARCRHASCARRTRRAGTWCESGLGRPPSRDVTQDHPCCEDAA